MRKPMHARYWCPNGCGKSVPVIGGKPACPHAWQCERCNGEFNREQIGAFNVRFCKNFRANQRYFGRPVPQWAEAAYD